jgi:ppGpp synthetase/RelA/SpoT-type nucleotidyltranferase
MSTSPEDLQKEYRRLEPTASRFAADLSGQLQHLLRGAGVPLGAPIEHRVKSWDSITEKLDRKHIELNQVADLSDLVGLRLMLLFKRDVEKCSEIIAKTFEVIENENTGSRLKSDQFGYQSLHFLVRMPGTWLGVPSLKEFVGFKAEIQVRTLAQHIWAGASHFMQYKHEESVPEQIRRSIHRVSALLETVDLEFERVLDERAEYLEEIAKPTQDAKLNVDLLARILDDALPASNKAPYEPYSELLASLGTYGIETANELSELLGHTREAVLAVDNKRVQVAKKAWFSGESLKRIERGVFYSHVGLVRVALHLRFDGLRQSEYPLPRPDDDTAR